MRALLRVWPEAGFWSRPSENLWLAVEDGYVVATIPQAPNQSSPPKKLRGWMGSRRPDQGTLELEISQKTYDLLKNGRHYAQAKPIQELPGGSVTDCISLMKMRKGRGRPVDPAAYCAAIADRIEPGWRTKSRKRNEAIMELGDRSVMESALRDLGLSKATASRITIAYPAGRGLESASVGALQDLGATQAQARRLRASFSVVRACDDACEAETRGFQVKEPADVIGIVRNAIGRKEQEYFVALLLDARQRVTDILGVAVGSLAEVSVHPREVFREAIRRNAHSIIVAHNHPSGSAQPSEADLQLTGRLYEVGKLAGIPLLDSLVVARGEAVSLAQLGLLEGPRGGALRAAENPESEFILTGRGFKIQDNPIKPRNIRRARRAANGGR